MRCKYSASFLAAACYGCSLSYEFSWIQLCHIPVIVEQVSTRKNAPRDSLRKSLKHEQSSLHFGCKTTPWISLNWTLFFKSANNFPKENLALLQYVDKQASLSADIFRYIDKNWGYGTSKFPQFQIRCPVRGPQHEEVVNWHTSSPFCVKGTHHFASDLWREQAAMRNGSSSQNAEGS